LDETLLTDALRGLASTHGERVLRVKGIVHLSDQRQPFAVHAAGHLVHPPMPLQAPRVDDGLSRLMFITSGLGRNVVIDALAAVGTPAAAEP
jgi:G3E family GTPase